MMSDNHAASARPTTSLAHAGVTLVCFVLYALTAAPTILSADSPEFAAVAQTRGIAHAPGYPLYTMLGHVALQLPFDEPAYALNLLSAACLALAAPALMWIIESVVPDWRVAASVTLCVMFSYAIWSVGVTAEAYAPQLLMVSLTGAALVALWQRATWPRTLGVGALFGLTVAMAPASIFLAPGMLVAFLALKLTWAQRMAAGLLSLAAFALPLLYLPLAYQADPVMNAAGSFNAQGDFEAVDLTTLDGIWWLLRGAQFDSEFFADGVLLTGERLIDSGGWLFTNLLAFGFFLALVGAYWFYRERRGWLGVWLVCFLPYTYFFMTYGADDRNSMLGPSLFLLAILFARGLLWAVEDYERMSQAGALVALPILFLVLNFPQANANQDTRLREHTDLIAANLPAEAYVFGDWGDTMPLKYQQIAHNIRPDVDVYTLFFFNHERARVQPYVDRLLAQDAMVIFVGDTAEEVLDFTRYRFETIYSQPEGPHDRPVRLVRLHAVN